MRSIIIHYHLFKNAGSTMDSILQRSFGPSWRVLERSPNARWVHGDDFTNLAVGDPEVRAISSHAARLPAPSDPRIVFHPVVFIRHPVDRVRSVYDFERRQRASTPGSRAAREAGLEEYLRWRFRQARNGVIANFHALWLLRGSMQGLPRDIAAPAALRRAADLLTALPYFGVVERFEESIALLKRRLGSDGGALTDEYGAENVTADRAASLDDRLAATRRQLSDAVWNELLERNAADIELYRIASIEFERRLTTSAEGASPASAFAHLLAPDRDLMGNSRLNRVGAEG